MEIAGIGGFAIPATQHDAALWLSGSAYDLVFDAAPLANASVKELASVADETSSLTTKICGDVDLRHFRHPSYNSLWGG